MRGEKVREIVKRIVTWALVAALAVGCVGETGVGRIVVRAENVMSGDGTIAISLGGSSSACIKKDGSLWMWGYNKGSLGNGNTSDSAVPIKIMDNVKMVSVGPYHSGAIKEDGSLWMWGYNRNGRLGNGNTSDSLVPMKIMDDVKVLALSGGHSGAIKEDGSLWMWGANNAGQLGNGNNSSSLVPVKIMDDVKAISLGNDHSGAIKEDGSLWMWGANYAGQLGAGNASDSLVPIKIMDDVRAISLGSEHTGAIKEDGSLWMWGDNNNGELGNGDTSASLVPIKIIDDVKMVSLGDGHSGAIKEDGSLWMWGYNYDGELGNGDISPSSLIPIKIMDSVKAISLGRLHSGVIKNDGSLWMWGDNGYGQLGIGKAGVDISVPTQVVAGDGEIPDEDTSEDVVVTFPIEVQPQTMPLIRVTDEKGRPIFGATITYRDTTYSTLTTGLATIGNYKKGYPLEISKEGYLTKEVASFTASDSGCTTYCLTGVDSVLESVVLKLNDKETDLLTTEATINKFYKTTKFSIECKGADSINRYELRSGDLIVETSSDGKFDNLSYSDFTDGKPVYLRLDMGENGTTAVKRLDVQVVNVDPKVLEFSLGDDISIDTPASTPILGSKKIGISLGTLPVQVNITADNKMQIGINASELMKKDKDWFDTLKNLNKKNFSKYVKDLDKGKADENKLPIKIKVMGYLESTMVDMNSLQGKIFVELSASGDWESQYMVGPVPVVVETSVYGKLNADGSISFTTDTGFSGSLGVGGELGFGLYGGIGVAEIVSGGIYGTAGLGARYDIFPEVVRGLNQLYVKGEVGLKAKWCGEDIGSLRLIDGTHYIINNDTTVSALTTEKGDYLFVDNNKSYEDLSRSYLEANGGTMQWESNGVTYKNGNVSEATLQESTRLDIVPKVVTSEDSAMLFYLSDAGEQRDSADRSVLVYSIYDDATESWSTPLPVLEDNTADFNPDVYAYGNKVYVVWQNATESLAGDLTLNEMAERLILQVAVYDCETAQLENLGSLESLNALMQQRPQIVSNGEDVYVYWYENAEDNVLGLSGVNQFYCAVMGNEEGIASVDGEIAEAENVSISSIDSVSGNDIIEDEEMVLQSESSASVKWNITLLQNEENSIISTDAGAMNGKITYAYAAGDLDEKLEVTESDVTVIAIDGTSKILETGTPSHVDYVSVYGDETLTWYQNGDIKYVNQDGTVSSFFTEGYLTSSIYTLIANASGAPEVIFSVNINGSSNLYRIGYENGTYTSPVPITEQSDYIQNADGFISEGKTLLVYNKMVVDENFEEIQNSLCFGSMEHGYHDLVLQDAGSMIKQNAESGNDVLEITAKLYNAGTLKMENLTLSVLNSEGTVLETAEVDIALEAGEVGYGTAVFNGDIIAEHADYIVKVGGVSESNTDNNSVVLTLGDAELRMSTHVSAVSDTRILQISVKNTGLEACAGSVGVYDAESGHEYCVESFEEVFRGQDAYVEVAIDNEVFKGKDVLQLEICVTPDKDGLQSIYEAVAVYAPTYQVQLITDAGEETVFVDYGKTLDLPTNPQKDGYVFKGWYTDKDITVGMLYTEESAITEDLVLYACYVAENESISMEDCSVTPIPVQLYTGKEIKPSITVKWGSMVLNPKTDYTVSYSNNKEQGEAIVNIVGKGKYTGNISRTFAIKYPIDKAKVDAVATVAYTGASHMPEVVVTYNKKALTKNVDYSVTYKNNRNAGTAAVIITGKGKYSGTKTANFTIKGIKISSMVFEKPENTTYTGEELRQTVTVKTKDGKYLRAGSDYKLVYENAVNKGTATVTVIGNGNYEGTKKFTYKIQAKALTKDMVSEVADMTYTGGALTPAVNVTDGDRQLVVGTDYKISYSKNKAVGTGTVIITGKGNYSGTVKVPFAILPKDLSSNASVRVEVTDMAYTGKAVKPKVTLYDGTTKIASKFYTVSYADNVELGTGKVVITGKGNYIGTTEADFRIVEKAKLISKLKIAKIADNYYTGDAVEPKLTITDGDYTLVEGVDYETIYSNQYNAGKATATVIGKGSYAGSKAVTYKIKKRAIAKKNVLQEDFAIENVADQLYTGYALKPDVVVRDGDKVLQLGTDYKLSYKKNTKIGTAGVTITGIGNYEGSINTVTFNIVSWDYSNLKAEIATQVYTGKALKPQVIFRINGEEINLKSNTAVKITYWNNKDAGTAMAVIAGVGELKGMPLIKVPFEIEKASLQDAVVSKIPNQKLKGAAVQPIPKVKVGKNTLKAGRDFKVSYIRNGVKGEAQVIITGIGNYTDSCRKTFIVQ